MESLAVLAEATVSSNLHVKFLVYNKKVRDNVLLTSEINVKFRICGLEAGF